MIPSRPAYSFNTHCVLCFLAGFSCQCIECNVPFRPHTVYLKVKYSVERLNRNALSVQARTCSY